MTVKLLMIGNRVVERRPWTFGASSRPQTSIETKDGYFTVSKYDPEQDAWIYQGRTGGN
jgi:hypothetical protein